LKSFLFTPGNKPEIMHKSLNTEADVVIFDLEDSVPNSEKEAARGKIISILDSNPSKEVYVRVNGIFTPWSLEDIFHLYHYSFSGFIIPKVNSAGDIEKIEWIMDNLYNKVNENTNKKNIIPIIETPEGVLNAQEIAKASSHLKGIMFGAVDYIHEIRGIAEDEFSLVYAKSQVVTACRSKGLLPIDTVYPNFKDQDGLERESLRSRAMGFAGKACIHPSQISIINQVFSPSSTEISWAKKVFEAYEIAKKNGKGVISVDGFMVDLPVAEKAKEILSLINYEENQNRKG